MPLETARPAINPLPLKSEEAMIIKESIPTNIPMAMCIIISGTENMGSIMKPIGDWGSEVLIVFAYRFIHIPENKLYSEEEELDHQEHCNHPSVVPNHCQSPFLFRSSIILPNCSLLISIDIFLPQYFHSTATIPPVPPIPGIVSLAHGGPSRESG
ncbi:MAG: hypothetical protein QXL84_00130 [Thermoplasmata archaeon]